jgi:hypothetical protein
MRNESTIRTRSYTWHLDRPKPRLPNSYFWTWDHSTNWMLDDPGIQTSGCYNRYFKRPETFAEDYRRLIDLCAGLGIPGIVIWGFLRDGHGGIEAARALTAYAKSKGIRIMPGFGVTWYGGAYYEGENEHHLGAFLRKHPEARMLKEDGSPMEFSGEYGACIATPEFQAWLKKSVQWMFDEFDIGGFNFENGDLLVDHHPSMKALRKSWPEDDPEPFFHQGISYKFALDACGSRLKDAVCAYATYTGFNITETLEQNTGMGKKPPAMLSVLPRESIAQWTLTGMLLRKPLPLTAWLDNGLPDAAFENPNWPRDLKPPCTRSVGFVHQGSQWSGLGRYDLVMSSVKEACLRAYRSGLEGVSIHGEVSSLSIPNALNYLAFSHFIHWPEDNLREFGRRTLGPVLGSEAEGEEFVKILAHWDAGTLTDEQKKRSHWSHHGFTNRVCASDAADADDYQRFRFWEWLSACAGAAIPVKGGRGV